MLRLLLGFSLLLGCSGPSSQITEDASPQDAERLIAEDPHYAMAKLFDDLVQNRLDAHQVKELETNCRTTPQASVFCHGVLNRMQLAAKAKELEKELLPIKYQGRTYRAQFNAKNRVLNWNQIKGAPLTGLLRGMPKGTRSKMRALKQLALRETECPNNIAIAVAATMEDQLPKKITFDEIGRLYEKGGICLADSPSERETVLTRAGLFYFANGSYDLAQNVFQQASDTSGTFTARALYWLYRTQTHRAQSGALATLEKLKAKYPFSFHSLVALTAADQDPGELLSRATVPATRRSRQDPDVNPLLEEVEILHRLGFDPTAAQVLNWAVAVSKGGIEPEVLLYIAELKNEQGDYKTKISILSEVLYQNPLLISRGTMELYFPKVLFPFFEKQSSLIDPYFLLAIARRESAFDAKAVSSANARGLLQVMPQTGRRIRKRPNLFDPETNIAVGAKYITELLKRTQGQVHLALAAYNAGPARIKTWARNYPVEDPILFTDLIPFRETREYVGSVLRNYYWYRRIHQANTPISSEKILELAIADKN